MKLRRWFLADDERLVAVRSCLPSIDRHGLWGPCLLVERRGHRATVRALWNRAHLLAPWASDEDPRFW
ncbi:hypothetical protein LAZ40_09425 [Cereibacter sphaeroides]|uniref:hypothetical protein n=1 Tax=Cereibacter sphaeroides TaxID=1063 RepID=UPI001F3F9B82|nr:hypothetical protein [Cereibacter sphaeroides]MCE6959272.1 hypothetical protein [Cereibacter sphaeroides]MCE6972864.1 hypothetical protein [Cereibacter sphaeroides]